MAAACSRRSRPEGGAAAALPQHRPLAWLHSLLAEVAEVTLARVQEGGAAAAQQAVAHQEVAAALADFLPRSRPDGQMMTTRASAWP